MKGQSKMTPTESRGTKKNCRDICFILFYESCIHPNAYLALFIFYGFPHPFPSSIPWKFQRVGGKAEISCCIYTNQDWEASRGEDVLENKQSIIKITVVILAYIYGVPTPC